MSQIRVTIDRLALQGFDSRERAALVEGLKAELARTLADPASRAVLKSRRTPVVRVGNLPRETGTSGSKKFGTAVARAIGRSVKR
jgi:hypothetical protein